MTREQEAREKRKNKSKDEQKLGWKDYIALIIAMLTTTLLPLIIVVFILVAVVILVSVVFR